MVIIILLILMLVVLIGLFLVVFDAKLSLDRMSGDVYRELGFIKNRSILIHELLSESKELRNDYLKKEYRDFRKQIDQLNETLSVIKGLNHRMNEKINPFDEDPYFRDN